MSNESQTKRYELLVKVSGNSLQVNKDVLQQLSTWREDNIPVVVLSVIGQPKSGKTSLVNYVMHVMEENGNLLPKNPFPQSSDEEDPGCKDLQGEEGILLWSPLPCQHRGHGMSTWFFLDIWMEHPRMGVYKKLVDFCLNISSAVIFSERCAHQPTIYWSPELSTLPPPSAFSAIQNSLQLHFLIETDDFEGSSRSCLKDSPLNHHCNIALSDKLKTVVQTFDFLYSRCHYMTTSYIPVAQMKLSPEIENSVKFETITQIITCCLCSPLKINHAPVDIKDIVLWFEKCVDAINKVPSMSSLGKREPFSPPPVGWINPNSTLDNKHVNSLFDPLLNNNTDENLLLDADVEMTDLCIFEDPTTAPDMLNSQTKGSTASRSNEMGAGKSSIPQPLTKSKVPLKVLSEDNGDQVLLKTWTEYYVNAFEARLNEQQGGMLYFEEEDFQKHHKSILEEIYLKVPSGNSLLKLKLEKIAETWKSDMSKSNADSKLHYEDMVAKVDAHLSAMENQLYDQICRPPGIQSLSFPKGCFQNLHDKLSTRLPSQKLLQDFISSQGQFIFQTLSAINKMIQIYNNNFVKQFQEKLCVGNEEFDKLHEENLQDAKAGVNWEESPRRKLNQAFYTIIQNRKIHWSQFNKRIYEDEVRISKEACEHALNKFKSLMDEKITSTTLTEKELQTTYQRLSSGILTLFLKELEQPHTDPWESQQQHLRETLKSLEAVHIQKNKSHLKKVDLVRKEALQAGKQFYREEMRKTLSITKLSAEEFSGLSKSCYYKAVRKFQETVENSINKNISISMSWEDILKIALDEIKLQFAKENENKDITKPKSYAQAAQQKPYVPEAQHQQPRVNHTPPVDRYGVGLYIDPQQVCVGVYVNQSVEFLDNMTRYDPTITIANGGIFVGEEGFPYRERIFSEGLCSYNIFALLGEHLHVSRTENIAGSPVQLGPEEMLSLYFQRIRMSTEQVFKHNISSCHVAVTGLLSSAAKQILKTSLKLAGFEKNTLISCTTAMAISYWLKFLRGGQAVLKNHPTLLTYTCSTLVEVASAEISDEFVKVINLCGDTNVFNHLSPPSKIERAKEFMGFEVEESLDKRLRYIYEDYDSPFEYHGLVLCNATKSASERNEILISKIMQQLDGIRASTLSDFDVIMDILRVAALLDAIQKGHTVSPIIRIPDYYDVHPYKISLKIDRRPHNFSDFNNRGINGLSSELYGDSYIIIYENAKASKDMWAVQKYKVTSRCNSVILMKISLNIEGNLTLVFNPEGYFTQSDVRSLIPRGRQEISTSMKPLLEELERRYKSQFPLYEPSSSNASQSNTHQRSSSDKTDGGSEASLEELKKSLNGLIRQIEGKLSISKSTTTAVKDNIKSKISKCQALMTSSDLNFKKLEVEKNNLERAAKLIKQ